MFIKKKTNLGIPGWLLNSIDLIIMLKLDKYILVYCSRRVTPLEPQFYGRDGFGKLEYVYGTIYSELGMSIHYDDVQRKIFFGAPGTWNWTGTTVA